MVLSAALLLGGITAPTVTAEIALQPKRIIGGPGHAFLYGWGAGTAPDGSVYITDYWNFEVKHFAMDGTYLGAFGRSTKGSGPGRHLSPYGIAADDDGNIYFGDVDAGRTVDKYSPAGQFITEWGGLGFGLGKYQYPSYLDVLSDGRIVIPDSRDHNVVITSNVGQEIFAFGGEGTANGKFKTPRGVAVCNGCTTDPQTGSPNDIIFIVDNNNARIQAFRYKPGGTAAPFLYKFGCKEDGINPDCHFSPGTNLRGADVDEQRGFLYVVDGAGDDIEKFNLQGTHLMSFGGTGTGDGKFADGGRDLTVAGDGNVWVGDMPNYRAQVFSPNGEFLFKVPSVPAPPPINGFNGPSDVAVSTNGFLYTADTRNQRIVKWQITPTSATAVLEWGDRGKSAYGFNYPRAISVDDSGASCPDPTDTCVYLADTDNGKIKKFTSNGNFLWSLGGGTTPEGSLKSWAMDVAPNANLYVGNLRTADVAVLSPSGSLLFKFGSKGTNDGQFVFVRGLAVDSDGSVWVTDSGRGDIQHFSATGAFLGKIVPSGVGEDKFSQIGDIVVSGNYLLVADTKLHKLRVYTKGGSFVGAFSGGGSKLGRMFGPQGMDLLGNQLYTMEATGERITNWQVNIT
jgi:sugar lactone lactonase YvrE